MSTGRQHMSEFGAALVFIFKSLQLISTILSNFQISAKLGFSKNFKMSIFWLLTFCRVRQTVFCPQFNYFLPNCQKLDDHRFFKIFQITVAQANVAFHKFVLMSILALRTFCKIRSTVLFPQFNYFFSNCKKLDFHRFSNFQITSQISHFPTI